MAIPADGRAGFDVDTQSFEIVAGRLLGAVKQFPNPSLERISLGSRLLDHLCFLKTGNAPRSFDSITI